MFGKTNQFLQNLRAAQGEQPFNKPADIRAASPRVIDVNTKLREKFDRLNSDIDAGKMRGTEKYSQNEYETLSKMDRLYRLLSNEFQDRFYEKHFDKANNRWSEVSPKEMMKESQEFLKEVVDERGLNDEEFANGKTFIDNFRKYNYNKILLPDINDGEDYTTGVNKYILKLRPLMKSSNTKPTKERAI